jgi:hypothetical protein
MTPRSQAILDGIVDKWIGEQSPYYRKDDGTEPKPMSADQLMRVESRKKPRGHHPDDDLHPRGIPTYRFSFPSKRGIDL